MYPLLVCDLEGCIFYAENTYILILNPSFNLFIVKKQFVSHNINSFYQEPFQYKTKQ
jgi:hypothetical protein